MAEPHEHEHEHSCSIDHEGGPEDTLARVLPQPPPLDPEQDRRVAAVMRALTRLRRRDPTPLSQGLSPANAATCMGIATGAITRDGLARAIARPGQLPRSLSLVAAHGVFSSPLEWACLYAAAGIPLRIKAPSRDPRFCEALAQDLSAEGLPVSVSTSRDLGSPDAVVAMGDDPSMAAIARATPGARHALFGHRFSVVILDDDAPVAQTLAWDTALYDTRGCMAPAVVFVIGDPEPLAQALATQLEQLQGWMPRGEVDPALGPEWRRRVGLARARGSAIEGDHWAVLTLPVRHITPSALPRMLVIHPVPDGQTIHDALAPWKDHLSALGTDDALRHEQEHLDGIEDGPWRRLFSWFPRISAVGTLQRPPFPREHDGQDMLGCVLG